MSLQTWGIDFTCFASCHSFRCLSDVRSAVALVKQLFKQARSSCIIFLRHAAQASSFKTQLPTQIDSRVCRAMLDEHEVATSRSKQSGPQHPFVVKVFMFFRVSIEVGRYKCGCVFCSADLTNWANLMKSMRYESFSRVIKALSRHTV